MATIRRRSMMDPVLLGITIGVLFTTGVALWQRGNENSRRSQPPAQKITTDTTTKSTSEMGRNS